MARPGRSLPVVPLELARLPGQGTGLVRTANLPKTPDLSKFRGFPKPPSHSLICKKDSQNSLEAIILRERIQIENQPKEEVRRAGSRRVPNRKLRYPPDASLSQQGCGTILIES